MRGKKKIAAQLFLILPTIVLFNTGCLTPLVWKAEVRQPVKNPHLSLSAAPDNSDVLVQYDEHQSDKVHHRSYWLFEYVSNKGGEGRPRFLRPAAYTNLELTPIPLAQPVAENAAPVAGFAAMHRDERWSFELSRDGAPLGHFDLPVYEVDAKPTFGRVALTPLAAIGDGVIVVGASVTIVGGAALILAAESSLDGDDDWLDSGSSSGSSCHTSHKSGGLHATRRSD